MISKEHPPSPPSAGDLEAGFSGGSSLLHRRATFFFDDYSNDEFHHFLDSCFLCKKHLRRNRDIYMYRGDIPFCSEECRQEQIEIDEARERNWKVSMMEKQKRSSSSSSPAKSRDLRIRLGIVVPV